MDAIHPPAYFVSSPLTKGGEREILTSSAFTLRRGAREGIFYDWLTLATHPSLIITYTFLIFKETIRKPLVFSLYGRILHKFFTLQKTNLNIFYCFFQQTAGISYQTQHLALFSFGKLHP